MRRNRVKILVAGLALSVLGAGGLAFAGVASSGAYFSDTVTANQSSSIAYVALGSPTSNSAAFSNLLPGTPQSRVISVTNTGTVAEDVYLKEYAAIGLPSDDSTPSLLTVSFSAPSSGLNSSPANLSPQSVLVYSELPSGASFNLTVTLSLALSAGGTYDAPTNWNQPNLTVTIPFKLVGFQTGLGWQVIS
jgi:hypothetical protein